MGPRVSTTVRVLTGVRARVWLTFKAEVRFRTDLGSFLPFQDLDDYTR